MSAAADVIGEDGFVVIVSLRWWRVLGLSLLGGDLATRAEDSPGARCHQADDAPT